MSGHVDACIGDQDRDIKTGTCSMSVYKRRGPSTLPGLPLPSEAVPIPDTNWRGGNGIAGGWDQMLNGDCAFLSGGEQRNWWWRWLSFIVEFVQLVHFLLCHGRPLSRSTGGDDSRRDAAK